MVYIDNGRVIKESTERKAICPNTTGDYAFIDGKLKSFNIDTYTGEYSYNDLDYTITSSTKWVIWLDSLVYAVIDDATTGENTYYDINVYKLNPKEKIATAILSTKGLQNHDNTLRNLSSGNFGNGIITAPSSSILEIVYIANNQVFTNTLTYKNNKYYSGYDSTATPSDVAKGKIFYNKDGKAVGTKVENTSTYFPLTYIESSGSQYIDTGITTDDTVEFEMKVNMLETSREFMSPIGSREVVSGKIRNGLVYWHKYQTNNKKSITFGKDYSSGTTGIEYNSTYSHMGVDTILTFKNKILTISSEQGTETIQPTLDSPFSSAINMWLFCDNTGGSTDSLSNMRLYYCKIWKNGELVRDFIPCTHYTGHVCLLDQVSNTFFYSKSRDNFIAGELA